MDQLPCPKCGKIFLRMCHLLRHVKPGVCDGSRKTENDASDEILPITYSAERARRIEKRIKMNTPIVFDSDVDIPCSRRLTKEKMLCTGVQKNIVIENGMTSHM